MRGALFLVGLLATEPSLAKAEAINLSCSGTYWQPGTPPVNAKVTNHGVQVDLESKQVFGLYNRVFPITRISQTDVGFYLDWFFDPGVAGSVGGSLDRITGKLDFTGMRSKNPPVMAFTYELECRPAKPLF